VDGTEGSSVTSIEDRIAAWRAAARTYGRDAQAFIDSGDREEAQYCATFAAMYFAAAMDLSHFGEPPPYLSDEPAN
jgi:hypothetical protein